jgi:hypothetical protein
MGLAPPTLTHWLLFQATPICDRIIGDRRPERDEAAAFCLMYGLQLPPGWVRAVGGARLLPWSGSAQLVSLTAKKTAKPADDGGYRRTVMDCRSPRLNLCGQ